MHRMSTPSVNLLDPNFFLAMASLIAMEWSDSLSLAAAIIWHITSQLARFKDSEGTYLPQSIDSYG